MPNVSHQQIINSLWREGDYWDQTTITYSIPATSPESSFNESGGFQPIGYGATRIAAEAFELWDDLIAINLNENTTTNANITLAYTTAPHEGDLFGYARTDAEDGATDYVIENAKVWINANKINPQDVSAGTYGFFTYVHEIGHALGLDHPGNYNHDDDEYDYATDRGHEQDTRQYTAMSYFAARERRQRREPQRLLCRDAAAARHHGDPGDLRQGHDDAHSRHRLRFQLHRQPTGLRFRAQPKARRGDLGRRRHRYARHLGLHAGPENRSACRGVLGRRWPQSERRDRLRMRYRERGRRDRQ